MQRLRNFFVEGLNDFFVEWLRDFLFVERLPDFLCEEVGSMIFLWRG